MIKEPASRKVFPIALLNKQINLDQLLAIHNAMKYPLAYIQGPPGTGKTNTIVNTLVTAFFNEQTVLFTSYNNHPIDGELYESTRSINIFEGTLEKRKSDRVARTRKLTALLQNYEERLRLLETEEAIRSSSIR